MVTKVALIPMKKKNIKHYVTTRLTEGQLRAGLYNVRNNETEL